jgi:hypothetical protein
MLSSGMLRHVALVRTDVSKERSVSIIRVTRIGELGTTLAVTFKLGLTLFIVHLFFHHDDGGNTFLRNVGSYKDHTA